MKSPGKEIAGPRHKWQEVGHPLVLKCPASGLIGETCLREFAVAAVGTAAGAALDSDQRRAGRGLQFLKGENVRHRLPPFFCDSPAEKIAGDSKRRAVLRHA